MRDSITKLMEEYAVVIVGAGPAGLKCAEILAQNGKKVLVLEKNKILGDKVCAGGLTLKDLELGIPDSIIQRKFKRVFIHTPRQTAEIKLEKPFIATIDRKDLGKWMTDKARRQGAEVRINSKVTEIDGEAVTVNGKDKILYKYLVGADGSNSSMRKYLNLKTDKFLETFQYIIPKKCEHLEVFIDPEKFGPLYSWLFPHRNLSVIGGGSDFKRGLHKPTLNLKISDIRKNFEDQWSKKFDLNKSLFQAAMINYDYKGHDFKNKFLIGDAAGLASGLTGEGIYFAIKSGEDVANKIVNSEYECVNIKHILKVKSFEEKILGTLEISKSLTKIEVELVNWLFKSRWVDKLGLKIAD